MHSFAVGCLSSVGEEHLKVKKERKSNGGGWRHKPTSRWGEPLYIRSHLESLGALALEVYIRNELKTEERPQESPEVEWEIKVSLSPGKRGTNP